MDFIVSNTKSSQNKTYCRCSVEMLANWNRSVPVGGSFASLCTWSLWLNLSAWLELLFVCYFSVVLGETKDFAYCGKGTEGSHILPSTYLPARQVIVLERLIE